MAAFNAAIFRQLKRLFHSDQFSSARNEIKKVLFQIGLTNLIAIIFVGCQVAYAIWVGFLIVSWFSFVIYFSLFRNFCLFQVLYTPENQDKFCENPWEWETLYEILAYIWPIMIICRLLNCSLNFYAFMLLRYRNQRAETRRRQERQQDREMVNLNPNQEN